MARAVERIEQELTALNQAVAALAQEFYDTYSQYLKALSQAARQQVILASYHLCTHGYPEQFLQLSLQQRQQLQHALRQLAKQSQTELLDCLTPIQPRKTHSSKRSLISQLSGTRFELEKADEAALSAMLNLEQDIALVLETEEMETEEMETEEMESKPDLQNLAAPIPDRSSQQSIEDLHLPPEQESPEQEPPERESPEQESPEQEPPEQEPPEQDLSQENLSPVASDPNEPSQATQTPDEQASPIESEDHSDGEEPSQQRPIQPKDILLWQEDLEESIAEQLQDLSHAANQLLQRSKVLPGHLPEPVLEVAARADLATESTVSPPNLLNLIIETENEEDKETSMTQVMAIRLRLAEIEFGDTSATVWRSKIRDLLGQLNKLGRTYQKKQKERSVAQAEAAWRSSWYED